MHQQDWNWQIHLIIVHEHNWFGSNFFFDFFFIELDLPELVIILMSSSSDVNVKVEVSLQNSKLSLLDRSRVSSFDWTLWDCSNAKYDSPQQIGQLYFIYRFYLDSNDRLWSNIFELILQWITFSFRNIFFIISNENCCFLFRKVEKKRFKKISSNVFLFHQMF